MPSPPARPAPRAAVAAVAALAALAALPSLAALPAVATAQATPNVDPLDPAYRALDVLAALGMTDAPLVGQRPYSRREIARLAGSAARTAARWAAQVADPATPPTRRRRLARRLAAGRDALDALAPALGPLGGVRALDLATADVTATDAVRRAAPGTPLGTSDAGIDGLTQYREGRPVVRGTTAFVETGHWAASRWIAASARLRARLAGDDDAPPDARYPRAQALAVHDAHLRLVAGPWALTAGRDHLVWGQGRHGGPLLSTNAPALDLVSFATDVPVRVPLVSRLLGPMKGTAFWADLGPRQNFPGANLSGFRLGALPFPALEIGVGTVNQWGGRGAPTVSLRERVFDQLVIVDSFGGVADIRASNKVAGADLRLRVPALGGLAAYYEVQFDDFDRARVGSSFREDAAHVAGIRAAALGPDGRWELGVEGRRTGLRMYQHTDFTSGITYERFFVGDPLGPQARAAYLRAGRRAGGGGAWLDLAAERRRNDQYVSVEEPRPFRFVLTERRPAERRLRAVATWESPARGRRAAVAVLAQTGVERVTGFGFAAGTDRTDLLARVGVELRPR